MPRVLFILVILVTVLSLKIESSHAVTFKLTNYECRSYNQSWVIIHICHLKVMKRNQIGTFYNGTILRPAKFISVRLQLFKRANGYKPWLINTRLDACRFIKNQNYNPIAKVIGSFFLDFTNLNHTCPYNGTTLMTGFYLRPELLVLPLPTGDYKLAMGWFFDNKLQYDTNMSFTFVENLIDQ